jgi:hypothetical protein
MCYGRAQLQQPFKQVFKQVFFQADFLKKKKLSSMLHTESNWSSSLLLHIPRAITEQDDKIAQRLFARIIYLKFCLDPSANR